MAGELNDFEYNRGFARIPIKCRRSIRYFKKLACIFDTMKWLAAIGSIYLLVTGSLFAQSKIQFSLETTVEQCLKASATLRIEHPEHIDSIAVQWSTGGVSDYVATQLAAGDYHIQLYLRLRDSAKTHVDTLIHFAILKEPCPLNVPAYFSPNGDNYADNFEIGNISYYPNFAISIYNRQGTRVHHQENDFEPWDGRWLGAPLPDGTYYYILYYDKNNKTGVVKGDVTILR